MLRSPCTCKRGSYLCASSSRCYFHPKQPQKVSPIALIHSLQVRKYKFREAQTLAKVSQWVRSKAGIQAQGSVTPKPGWILSYFVGKSIFRLEGDTQEGSWGLDTTEEELGKDRRARASGGRQGVAESGEANGSDVRWEQEQQLGDRPLQAAMAGSKERVKTCDPRQRPSWGNSLCPSQLGGLVQRLVLRVQRQGFLRTECLGGWFSKHEIWQGKIFTCAACLLLPGKESMVYRTTWIT